MRMRVEEGLRALTEKEKQTLRLIVRGHDAKSTARSLGLSVHTINERLRDARRKMAVSSSREAARLLFEAEAEGVDRARSPLPEKLGDEEIGNAMSAADADREAVPVGGARRIDRRPWIIGGLMTLVLGLLALAAVPQSVSPPPPLSGEMQDPAVVDAARQWLLLVDGSRWDESYRATAAAFRKLNTARTWAAASQKVRVPLGAVISRVFVSQEDSPTPPRGYELVKFRTTFANKADAVETVALDREDGRWHVVGVYVG